MPFWASSGVTSTSFSAKSGKPAAIMHALTTAIVRLPWDCDIRLFLLSGDLTFEAGDRSVLFLDGSEGAPEAFLPAGQCATFVIEPGTELLDLALPLESVKWIGWRPDKLAPWRGHFGSSVGDSVESGLGLTLLR
jgi:hypothetical protein